MSVGITYTKPQLDNATGSLVIEIENSLRRVEAMGAYLATQTNAQLLALGYIQAEIDTMKSAFVTDLTQLSQAYRGAVAISPARDLRTFTTPLRGPGL